MKKSKAEIAFSRRKKAKKSRLTVRRGITLISILAIVILIINIFTASYSWFLPTVRKSTGISYQTDINFRSENCKMSFFYGTRINGEMTYYPIGDSAIAAQSIDGDENNDLVIAAGKACTVYSGRKAYFMAEITNDSTDYPTIVSLFMSTFPASLSTGKVNFGVSYPSNTYRSFSTAQTDMHIIRNAYLNKNDGNNDDCSLSVEWFVEAVGQDITFDLDDIYLMYN
jgi:hypothetical protein